MKLKLTASVLALTLVGAGGAMADHHEGGDEGGGEKAMASGGAAYGMAGCGLGSFVISSNGFLQVFAATTNGTFASQTFGITTGTSNCTADGVVLASKEQEAFFETNYANLQRDMAAGGGEYLTALTDMFACQDDVQADVAKFAQSSYESVFPNSETTGTQALYTFKIRLSQNSKIANACSAL